MARKNPLGKIKDVADVAVLTVVGSVTETVKDPVGTGQKLVGSAVGQAAAAAGAVTSRVGRKGSKKQQPSAPVAVRQEAPRKTQGDPVKPAAAPEAEKAPAKKTAAKKAPAKKAPAKKAPAKKSAAKKAPAPDATALAKKGAKKAPATKAAAKKSS